MIFKRRFFDIFVIVVITVTLCLLIFSLFLNKGTLTLNVPADTVILINGKVEPSSVTLRPGKYDVSVVGKDYSTETKTVAVERFKKTTESFNNKKLSTQQIIQDVVGNSYGVELSQYTDAVKLFSNGTVIAGRITMGSPALFALQYDNGWRPIYFEKTGFQQNYELLDSDVSTYLKKLASEYTGG